MSEYSVEVFPTGQTVSISSETSLLEGLKKQGIQLKSKCGGVANCSDCIVKILAGEGHINASTFEESRLIGNVFHITKERLSCQVFLSGDIKIDISGHLEDKKKIPVKVRKPDQQKTEVEGPDWHKHWEKGPRSETAKKGGMRRPKQK